MGGKVLVIGLDGATWDIMRPLVRQGRLPNIAKLISGGVHGDLISTIPPVTALAWPSMFTGCNPGKHGLFDFVKSTLGSYSKVCSDSRDIKAKSLWRILSDAGKKCIVVDVPMTYPPEEINGIMISGIGNPLSKNRFTRPDNIQDELEARFGKYRADVFPRDLEREPGFAQMFIDEVYAITEQKVRVCEYLMDEYPWDFFMLVFMGTDRIQHYLWGFTDPSHPAYNASEGKLKEAINDYYAWLDGKIGGLLGKLDSETNIVAASDHGFGPFYAGVNMGGWLMRNGYMQLEKRNRVRNGGFQKMGDDGFPKFFLREGKGNVAYCDGSVSLAVESQKSFAGIMQEISGLDPNDRYRITVRASGSRNGVYLEIQNLANKTFPILKGFQVSTTPSSYSVWFTPNSETALLSLRISSFANYPTGVLKIHSVGVCGFDWSKSAAYPCPERIFINLKGREPMGCVEPEDYEKVRDDIIRKLAELRHPATGRKIMKKVMRREDVYFGPNAKDAPDIAYMSDQSALSAQHDASFMARREHGLVGNHRMNGIFLLNGPDVRAGAVMQAQITDLAPTILYLMGLPVPTHMDGHPLTSAVKPGRLKANPIAFAKQADRVKQADSRTGSGDEDTAELMVRLKKLGYV